MADGADERETIGVATKIVCNALSENKKATETEERKEKEKWQAANLKCKKGERDETRMHHLIGVGTASARSSS